jgi:glucosamine--fructose-6-phosphate aminotransferase (isomerizing)
MQLNRMIHGQADALEALADLDLKDSADVLSRARRVVLVGTGTSQHAAELGALMAETAGVDVRWSSSARWTPRPDEAVVLISHTAETSFARRVRHTALAGGIPLVTVTGAGRGWPEAIETVPAEASETYTISYTATLAVLARLAHALGAPLGSAEELGAVAARVREVCAEPGVEDVPVPARALALTGHGPLGITAREGALKIREGARILAEGYDSEYLLHGSAVPFAATDGLVVLAPETDPDGLTEGLAVAGAAEGLAVSRLEGGPGHPLLAQIPMTVRLQLLAARYAGLRGQDPDRAIVGAWAAPGLWALGGL